MEIESVRTITEIIDAETGELLHIDNHFFHQNEAYLFLLRRRLYEYAYLKIGQPKYLCAVCRQPVVLLGKRTTHADGGKTRFGSKSPRLPFRFFNRQIGFALRRSNTSFSFSTLFY